MSQKLRGFELGQQISLNFRKRDSRSRDLASAACVFVGIQSTRKEGLSTTERFKRKSYVHAVLLLCMMAARRVVGIQNGPTGKYAIATNG